MNHTPLIYRNEEALNSMGAKTFAEIARKMDGMT